MERYVGDFKTWADVSQNFSGEWDEAGEKAIPVPSEVIFAHYHRESYEGDAIVIFRKGRKFFVVEGSHCSCHGLEGQFQPIEYNRQTLIAALEKRMDYGSFAQPYKDQVLKFLKKRVRQ